MSQPTQPTPPTIILFARGTLALLDLWPALTIAVAEQWGGPESSAKKTWLASTIIDEFESRASYLPSDPTVVDPATANDPPLELDDLADLLQQIMSDEFDANIDDGSLDSVSSDIIRLWRDLLQTPASGATPDQLVSALESKAEQVKRSGINAHSGGHPDVEDGSDSGEGEEDGEEGMQVDGGEAPQLVDSSREETERQEPEVDEEGFTMVRKGRRR